MANSNPNILSPGEHSEGASSRPTPLGSRSEVAEYLGVPVSTLDRWARLRAGPPYARVGRHTRYRWSDVEAWLTAQTGQMS